MAVNLRNYLNKARGVGSPEWYAWANVGVERHSNRLVRDAMSLYEETSQLLDEIETQGDFSIVWPRVRTWMPLQFRLCAEQVMWDRGGAWRRYVTGFRPVEGRKATLEIVQPRETPAEARAALARLGKLPLSSREADQLVKKRLVAGARERRRTRV